MLLQDGDGYGLRPRPRLLDSTEETEYNLMTAGEFGDDSITSIPFQVMFFCFLQHLSLLLNVVLIVNVVGLVEIGLIHLMFRFMFKIELTCCV